MIENFSKLKIDFANEILNEKGEHEQKERVINYESLFHVSKTNKLEFYKKLAANIEVPFFNSKTDSLQIGLANAVNSPT